VCCVKVDRFSDAKFVMFSLCNLRCAIFKVFFVRVACVEIRQRCRIRLLCSHILRLLECSDNLAAFRTALAGVCWSVVMNRENP
jgi:hypothetical protein